MAHVLLTDADPVLAVNASHPAFDPYSTSGERVMSRIDALIADGQVMSKPVV